MRVLTLTLKNFRNIEFEKIDFRDGINVLVGKNAQGKTNILEAISFCSYLKSFRAVKDEQLIRFKQQSAKILLEFEKENQLNIIEIEIFKDCPKVLRLNGLPVFKNRELIGQFLSIIFTPDHLNLIKEGPNKRRSFLDMALCALDVKYTDALLRHQKILLQRNALLKKINTLKQPCELLDVYDAHLAKEGAYIAFCRARYLRGLEPFARETFKQISKTNGNLKLLYINQFAKEIESREMAERVILDRYRKKREIDIAMQMTTTGIQKDDFLILNSGKSFKFFGSQGQIRSAVLSLILAQSEVINQKYGIYPVVILDDILSELDRTRRAFIFKNAAASQSLISTCQPQSAKNNLNIIKISGGRVI